MGRGWIEDCRKIIHMDFHMPEFPQDAIRCFDPKAFVGELARAGADAVAIFAKDHFGMSFYDTEVGHRHKGLRQDFLGEVIREAHARGIRVLIYLSAAWDKYNIEKNPDWRQCGKNGEPLLKNAEWEWGCLNSPYKEESIFRQVRELCEKYPADGFFFDAVMMQEGGCYCRYCREKYNRRYHADLLEAPQEEHKRYMGEVVTAFIEECASIIKSYHPDAMVCMNSSWELGQDYHVAAPLDFIIIEAQPAHLHVGEYALISIQSRYARTLGKPFQIVTVRFAEGWGEMTLKELPQLEYEFSLIASNGGIVCCGDQVYPDGTLEPYCYDRLEKAFGYLDEKQEGFGGTHLREAAIFYRCGQYYPISAADFSHSLFGTAKMLGELHIQYDIIDQLQLERLEAYRLLIVPGDMAVTDSELEAFKVFAEKGGRVLVFGEAIWKNPNWEPLMGVRAVEPFAYTCGYYHEHGSDAMPLLVKTSWAKTFPAGAEEIASLYLPITVSAPPERGFRSGFPPAQKKTEYGAAFLKALGKGCVCYVAGDMPKVYWEYGHVWLKKSIDRLADRLLGDRLVGTDAPPMSECNVTQKGETLYLHFVTGSLNPPCRDSYAPMETYVGPGEVTVSLRCGKPKRIVQVGCEKEIPFVYEKSRVHFRAAFDEIYTLFRLEEVE